MTVKFTLRIVPIETQIKENFYLFIANEVCKIKKIYTEEDMVLLDNGYHTDITTASKYVAKFLAEVTKDDDVRTYSIIHSSYREIAKAMQLEGEYRFPSRTKEGYNDVYVKLSHAISDGRDIQFTGVYEHVHAAAKPGETVALTNLKLIDQYNLYNHPARLFTIKSYDKKSQTFKLRNALTELTVQCKREDFKRHQNQNTLVMVRLTCPICNR